MAYQLGGGRGFALDLNELPPEGGEQVPPPAAEVDCISSLPARARQRILGFLPLKTATMLGMVSRSWSRFVSKPQWPCDSILGIHICPAMHAGQCGDWLATHVPGDQIAPLLANDLVASRGRGPGPGRRLLRFFLRVEDAQAADIDSLLAYAAACDVEHVAVVGPRRGPHELAQYLLSPERSRRHAASALPELSFNFPRASHHLLALALVAPRRRRQRGPSTFEPVSQNRHARGPHHPVLATFRLIIV